MTPRAEILLPCRCGKFGCCIPFGFCHCGCGGRTTVARKTWLPHGMVKGVPMLYIVGHVARTRFARTESRVIEKDGVRLRTIPLTQGKEALVDEDVFELIGHKLWYAFRQRTKCGWYAARDWRKNGKKGTILMHGVVCPAPKGFVTDHIDGDGLNNCRSNLRVATHCQNLWNMGKASTNTSGFKGAFYQPQIDRWTSQIRAEGVVHYLGCFKTKEEAAAAYAEASIRLHGEFRRLTG